MRKNRKIIAGFLFGTIYLILTANFLHADTIYFKDGRRWEGIILKQNKNAIELDLGFDIARLQRTKIARIVTGSREENRVIRNRLEVKKLNMRNQRKAYELRPIEAPLLEQEGHLFAEVLLNNKIRTNLLIDTGASVIVLPREIGKALGVEPNRSNPKIYLRAADGRKLKAEMVILKSVKIRNLEVKNVHAAVLYDKPRDMVYKDGLLGMSFLRKFNFKIDYENKKIMLERLKDKV
jgi:clan AA aspartic protease (TIGR02281 family)